MVFVVVDIDVVVNVNIDVVVDVDKLVLSQPNLKAFVALGGGSCGGGQHHSRRQFTEVLRLNDESVIISLGHGRYFAEERASVRGSQDDNPPVTHVPESGVQMLHRRPEGVQVDEIEASLEHHHVTVLVIGHYGARVRWGRRRMRRSGVMPDVKTIFSAILHLMGGRKS